MGETFHDCIKRELKEELNLDLVKIDGLIYDSEYSHKDQKHLYTVFAIEVDGWENFRLETGKAIDFKWIHAGEIEILLDGKEESSPTFGAVSAFFSKN